MVYFKVLSETLFSPSMHNVEKWPDILKKSDGVHTASFLKYIWPFFNIMHERVKITLRCDFNIKLKCNFLKDFCNRILTQ